MGVITFFKEITWDMVFGHYSSFHERVLGVLMFVVIVGTIILVSTLSFVLINEVAIKEVANVSKRVVDKNFSPAHTQITFLLVGKVTVPQAQHIPDKWSLCFQFEHNIACGSVEQNTYNKTEVGQSYLVSYGVGRIDGRHIVKSIQQQ